MEFDEYLSSKKINASKFKTGDRDLYDKLKLLFDQVHPNSFTQQKLFLINRTRRKYLLESKEEEKPIPISYKQRPKIVSKKPKI